MVVEHRFGADACTVRELVDAQFAQRSTATYLIADDTARTLDFAEVHGRVLAVDSASYSIWKASRWGGRRGRDTQ